MKLLDVKGLKVTIQSPEQKLDIVRGIDFSLSRGEKLGIVGESGCGKSITALALMSLLPNQAAISGEITFDGSNLLKVSNRQMNQIRGNRIGMIFQEPMTALNPVKTIGDQIAESLILHKNLSRDQRTNRVQELLSQVGMPVKRFPLNTYPHQLSGGQRQRVMIAMAIACDPDILIADEPTTALDVTVQEQILNLISELVAKSGMALIMISHDLGVIAQTTEKVMVMYSGKAVETGSTLEVFKNMKHPYTNGLFAAIPKPGSSLTENRKRLFSIPGQVLSPLEVTDTCSFADRCQYVSEECRSTSLLPSKVGESHFVWCFHPVNGGKS